MKAAFTVMAAVVVLGLVYVVVPVVLDTYRRFRGTKHVTCPETKLPADIDLDATQASLSAIAGKPDLLVTGCSHWPERRGCDQECVAEVERSAG
jgi:hypothetical protein